ncbi:MAG: acylphosphatase [Fimbriimonas sp.]
MDVRIRVEGRVQGVGFRAFVRDVALELGLTGEVWNVLDGAVELVASGDSSQIALLPERLRLGPGRVDRLVSEPCSASATDEFRIGPTRP